MSSISTPEFVNIRLNIENALCQLYKNDLFLITNRANERAITHKLATYIQDVFPKWNVDCEYNRKGLDRPKAILSQDESYPDIIIHHRNTVENLLIIEAKMFYSNKRRGTIDKNKIKAYIEDNDYQYHFGLWIQFHEDISNTRLDWFKNDNGECHEVE